MPLPQVIVRRGDRGAAPIAADDVSAYFDLVKADRGPVGTAVECRSIGQVRQVFGDHSTTSSLRGVEAYFAEGGTRAVLSRVVGPDAERSSITLLDAAGRTVSRLSAFAQGAYYDELSLDLRVVSGRDCDVQLAFDDDVVVEGQVSSRQELIDLIATSGIVTADTGAVDAVWPPRAVDEEPFTGGRDDLDAIDVAEAEDGLAAFEEDFGAGSVCASGLPQSTQIHQALADHAAAFNRFARGDLQSTDTRALITHANTVRGFANARYIQLLAGQPSILNAGVEITVPASGVLCGREARADRQNGPGPGQPAAQSFGELATPVGVAHSWSKGDREALNDAGVTVIAQDPRGAIYAEDAITAVDPARYPQYAEVSAMRVTMAIHAQAKQALQQRLLQTIDGKGHVVAAVTGDLVRICDSWYERNALYGDLPEQAYRVSVEVETPTSGRARLVGYLSLRPSPSAHTIDLTITQVAPRDTI